MSLFESNNPALLEKDLEYWRETMRHLVGYYSQSKTTDEESSALRAFHASRIAAHCYAMAEHFEACVQTLLGDNPDTPDWQACVDAGERIFSQGLKHHNNMERLAEGSAS